MKFLVDDILVNENDAPATIRKKVADRLGANYRSLRIQVLNRRWIRNEDGGHVLLSVLAETNEFLRSTTTFAYSGDPDPKLDKPSWKDRPVVAGFGIPGIVAAYYLVKRGLKPIVLERGDSLTKQGTTPKDKETLSPDDEGGIFAHSGGIYNTDNMDKELRAMLAEDGILFSEPDAYRFLTPIQVRTIISKLHSYIVDRGAEILFNATYLGIKKRFGRFKGVIYSHEGTTKIIKTTKLLLTYGACDDVFFVGTSVPALPQNFNNCIYDRKIIDEKAAPFYVESEIKLPQTTKGLFLTGLKNARVMDIGFRSEMCLQTYNFDGKGKYTHSFIGVETTKEEAEKICKGAYDTGKPRRIPCSGVNDFLAKKNPLRLGSIKPERVADIRLDSFAKLMGAITARRLANVLNHYAKTYPYLIAKDSILEGLMVFSGCKDSEPQKIDGVYVSRVAAIHSMDFSAKATSGFRAAKLMCER